MKKLHSFMKKIYGALLTKISERKILKKYHNLKKELRGNLKFKDIHKGDRCFILGNGPSIKEQDLSLLSNEYVFTVNQIARNSQFSSIKPNYHFWADPIFFNLDVESPSDKEVYDSMINVNTEENKPICFYSYQAQNMIEKYHMDSMLDINYFLPLKQFTCNASDISFEKSTAGFHTVVQYAVTMAIYMGFSEIYLLGSEMTGILATINLHMNNDAGNAYGYNISEAEKNRMKIVAEEVPLYRSLYSTYRVLKDYVLLSNYCQTAGIKFKNCTPGGIVEGVERQKYEELFK